MKISRLIIPLIVCGLLASCFKDEPLNAECDIEQAYVHLDDPTEMFYSLTDTLVNVLYDESTVTFNVKEGADLTQVAPMFRITDGATISPESGSVHDFSEGRTVTYRVSSQDGNWSRYYNVRFVEYQSISEFHFENFYLTDGSNGGQFYVWTDLYPDGTEAGNWATANPAFNLSMGSAAPDEYPTFPTTDCHDGSYGVMAVTRSTGAFGALFGRRMAAGNIFLGYFDMTIALIDQLQATNFGVPFNRKPLRLTAWYKYKEGDTYTDADGNEVPGMHDRGNVYAVFYRNHDDAGNAITLNGNDFRTNPNIVAMAYQDGLDEAEDWTLLEKDFDYDPFGTGTENVIDEELLANHGYSLTVVCTSSWEGNAFRGCLGSTLWADEITIECEE